MTRDEVVAIINELRDLYEREHTRYVELLRQPFAWVCTPELIEVGERLSHMKEKIDELEALVA